MSYQHFKIRSLYIYFFKNIISISENSERSVYTGPTFPHDNNRQNLRSGWSLLMRYAHRVSPLGPSLIFTNFKASGSICIDSPSWRQGCRLGSVCPGTYHGQHPLCYLSTGNMNLVKSHWTLAQILPHSRTQEINFLHPLIPYLSTSWFFLFSIPWIWTRFVVVLFWVKGLLLIITLGQQV